MGGPSDHRAIPPRGLARVSRATGWKAARSEILVDVPGYGACA
jgi:hypothetical protein